MIQRLICFFRLHGMKTNSDEYGIWGECQHCGRRAGYVTRQQVRRYIDTQEKLGLYDKLGTPDWERPPITQYERNMVAANKCPRCRDELDTGWECTECGYDCLPIAESMGITLAGSRRGEREQQD